MHMNRVVVVGISFFGLGLQHAYFDLCSLSAAAAAAVMVLNEVFLWASETLDLCFFYFVD